MILLVGDETSLLSTRSQMLSEFGCVTTSSADAAEALCSDVYDLVVFCQTVPESVANELLSTIRQKNQLVKVLRILPLGCSTAHAGKWETYTVDFRVPGRLIDVVAGLSSPRPDLGASGHQFGARRQAVVHSSHLTRSPCGTRRYIVGIDEPRDRQSR